ncbi:Alpha/Beta hydrolase protein [Tricladium varicosporioides]|nr:Alpha/Beta hydrolase protein [Hymenoscyphus varicosporioides]
MAASNVGTVYQAIHPSIRSRLDPKYIEFHEKYLQFIPTSESTPWDPACRFEPSPSIAGRSPLIEVGSTRDFDYGGNEQLRIFTPKTIRPQGGWPVLIWMHGGGWTMGGLSSENSFLTRICSDVSCMVISVNYRHAPENPYPAAIDDVVAGFTWVVSLSGQKELGIDLKRIAVGGLSAGGGLAAILSLKAAEMQPPIPIAFQLIIVPVIDNTATIETSWKSNLNAPWLTPARMLWYRNMYLSSKEDWSSWDASPNLAPPELLAKSPKTWIGAAELDILCQEAVEYGEQLKRVGVETEIVVYPGSTHSILILDGDVLDMGKRLVNDACRTLKEALS